MTRGLVGAIATASGALLVLLPAAAAASPTEVVYTGAPDTGAEITVKAGPGEGNTISVSDHRVPGMPSTGVPGTGEVFFVIHDLAGVKVSSPYCKQVSPEKVGCETIGLLGLTVRTGDGDDAVVVTNRAVGDPGRRKRADHGEAPLLVRAGAGNDVVWVRRGLGIAMGETGNDVVAGGARRQRLNGGPGDDLVGNAGAGADVCDGGTGDDRGKFGCEISRSLAGPAFFFDIPAELG
jgi:Ca2+-binding RTX toxin-like protein